jgi:hypothetical protein
VLAAITIHAVWSAAIPILLTELLFPGRRVQPWLGRPGLVATGAWYILGVALLALLARTAIAPGHSAPRSLLAVTALVALVLVIGAFIPLPGSGGHPRREASAPAPWTVLLTTFSGSLIWHRLLALLWRIQPAFASWPLVLVPMLGGATVAAVMASLVRHWATARDWNDRHRLAVASGALVSQSLIGGAILPTTTVDRVGVAVLGAVTIAMLAPFATRLRARAGAS